MSEMVQDAAHGNRFSFVDSHLHLWDLTNGWYGLPGSAAQHDAEVELGLGELSAINRNYLYADYAADSADCDISGFVHVHAGTMPGANLDETRWLVGLAKSTSSMKRIVAQVDVTQPGSDVAAELDQHAGATELFIGARVLAGVDYESASGRALLRALAANGWVYDAVAHPGGGIRRLAKAAADHEQLSVVIEHAGWPLTADGTFDSWRSEMAELAQRPNVSCKLSGFAMWLHRIEESDLRPWLQSCVELFGPDRCIVGSNFPVDSIWTDFPTLLGAYRALTAQYGPDAQRAMFETNARRIYRF